MGGTSKIISVLLRSLALISSIIVAGLLGRFVHHTNALGFGAGSKVIYTLALSGLSIFFALLLLIPLKFSFWAFPLDFAFFVMWLVAFALLTHLSPSCGGAWFSFVWRFAWGSRRCGIWRDVLAFSFIASMMWLGSCLLGLYRTLRKDRDEGRVDRGIGKKHRFSRDSHQPMAESQAHGQMGQTVPVGNTAVGNNIP